jgi:hypothetical protein
MRKSEMLSKHECRNFERDTHHMILGVSISGFQELEVSRKLMTRMMKLQNVKHQNPETGTSTKTPFWSFTDREIKYQRNFNL